MEVKDIIWPKMVFVTGTGTDVGKTYATGWLARELRAMGNRCITLKMVQTGNTGRSEDIEAHRRIMGIGPEPRDLDLTTAPQIFSYPCSPDLASRIDGRDLDLGAVDRAAAILADEYDTVLIEGAGGLMVPLKGEMLTADWIAEKALPAVVVVSGQLGSINHALLTLNAVESYGIELFATVYNPYFDRDPVIVADTKRYLRDWIGRRHPDAHWLGMPM